MSASAAVHARPASRAWVARLEPWWGLIAITALAGALRLSTLDLQSLWYDEAFTPVHVLHASLFSTLRSVVHTENTPPLWYVLEWADARVLGSGALALRLPSALAGIALVPVAWAIGRELAGRRAAILCAAFVAVNPLFVWYSQEARAYGLFALTGALAMLCFLRAERDPSATRMAAFALAGSAALLSHYFAVFPLIAMVLWLLREPRTRRAALPAVGALALLGAALRAADPRAGRPRHAVDRRVADLRTPAGDTAVLPHRQLRCAARARRRAARRAADRARRRARRARPARARRSTQRQRSTTPLARPARAIVAACCSRRSWPRRAC